MDNDFTVINDDMKHELIDVLNATHDHIPELRERIDNILCKLCHPHNKRELE